MSYRLLDLFSGAGGTSMGYSRAGFEVVGVDSSPQPNYPFEFYQANALTFPLDGFDVVAASPPCQRYSQVSTFHAGLQCSYPDLIDPVRLMLTEWAGKTGGIWVIENVERAPLIKPVKLCGTMFGLRTYRHRLFESNTHMEAPPHPKHVVRAARPGAIPRPDQYWCVGGHFGHKDDAAAALGVGWMKTRREISESIPPAYTEHLGRQIIDELNRRSDSVRAA